MKSIVDKQLIKHIGVQIRLARKNAGLTQEKLAEKAGITQKYLSNLESGRNGVTITNLRNISRLLSVSMDTLVYGEIKENDIGFLLEQLRFVNPKYFSPLREVMEAQLNFIRELDSID